MKRRTFLLVVTLVVSSLSLDAGSAPFRAKRGMVVTQSDIASQIGFDVIRNGDDLILRMPSGITFPVDSYAIQPQFQQTLNEVAMTLATYNQTYIDVLGHTDSTGSDAYNQTLSVNRAQSVADYLSARGVARARIGVRGFGETQPIATNATEAGRAQNRRVEIKVVPVTQPGY